MKIHLSLNPTGKFNSTEKALCGRTVQSVWVEYVGWFEKHWDVCDGCMRKMGDKLLGEDDETR